jgi:hypothetical protein
MKDVKKPSFILDSYALLAFLQGEAGGGLVCDILKKALNDQAAVYLSVINLGEIYYIVGSSGWSVLMKNEPPASLKAERSTPRKYFSTFRWNDAEAKDFTPDGDDSSSRQGGGNLLESSVFPAFQNVFLCELGALSDQPGCE